MVSGVGSSYSYTSYLQTQTEKSRPDPAEMFSNVDVDGSGGISQAELETFAQDLSSNTGNSIDVTDAVSTYDTDGDGELNSDELMSFMEATMGPPKGTMQVGGGGPDGLFSALDTDSSSGVSQSELDEWAAAMSAETGQEIDTADAIATYDADEDGELNAEELMSFMDASGIKPPPPSGGAGMMGGAESTDDSTTSAASVIDSYDTNGDGVLSSAELQAYLDDQEAKMQQAVSAYSMNFGSDDSSDLNDVIMDIFGSDDNYTPVDLTT